MLNERLRKLADEAQREAAATDRMRHDFSEQCAFAQIQVQAARETAGQSALREKTRRLELFARDFPISRRPGERLYGSQRFTNPPQAAWDSAVTREAGKHLTISGNHGHIIPNFTRLLRDGVGVTRQQLAALPEGEEKECFERALDAFALFIRRHGEHPESAWVNALAERGATTWREALQLLWFAVIFLHVEGNCAAISLGRFDEFMAEYDRGDAVKNEEYLGEFLLKFTEGEESQNLTLSGRGGNAIFFTVLRLIGEMRAWQPSISVIVSPEWQPAHFEAVVALIRCGLGMPSIFGDATVRQALATLGDPPDAIDHWGIVGCYEAAPAGCCYALTTAYQGAMNQWFADFFQSEAALQPDFPAFWRAFRLWIATYTAEELLPMLGRSRAWMAQHQSSAFLSLWVDDCIARGRTVENGGARLNHFGLNLMGLGSVIDSLLTVKKLVFEDRELTLDALRQAVKDNFPDEALLQRCRALPGKYGSDTPESNALAAEFSHFLTRTLNARPVPGRDGDPAMVTSLGLFWFGGDICTVTAATPDGRRNGDPVSYGVGPGQHLGAYAPTAILNAAATLANAACPNGNPLQLTLDAATLARPEGRDALLQLLRSFFARGGFHLQCNVADPEVWSAAQQHPERHRDLVIRISGYSTLFNGVEKHWQDVLIERGRLGI